MPWATTYHGENSIFGIVRIPTNQPIQEYFDNSMIDSAQRWGATLKIPGDLFSPTATEGVGSHMIGE